MTQPDLPTITAHAPPINDTANATDATLLAPSEGGLASAQTVMAPPSSLPASGASASTGSTGARSTVLPRILGDGDGIRLSVEPKNRYEPIKLLGSGGMGEVLLVNDQDIARKVAVKRLRPDSDDPARLARFVDEIRTVGRLEHPNIVPIHDVGVDAEGRYFFVMKYVEGETLETIIKKLAEGDPEYLARYTIERRLEIFISLLNALAYAHSSGVVHRDIKPANVMVGRFGEVMLMDWGIAKPLAQARDLAATAEGALGDDLGGERGRMFATRVGSLIGTPAYMSPEQALGQNDRIDVHSDLYSATALLHELVSLHHYLEGKGTAEKMLASIPRDEVTYERIMALHEAHGVHLPRELTYVTVRGLSKDPAQRFQSADEMKDLLQRILEGKLDVQCSVTLTKRVLRESARMVDTRPRLVMTIGVCFVLAMLFTIAELVRLAIT